MKKKMGRPPLDNVVREERLFLKVSKEEAREIEELAEYLEIPKSTFVRNLTLTALDEAKILKKLGLLGLGKGIRKTSEALERFKEMKINKDSINYQSNL